MIKALLIIPFLFALESCSPRPKTSEFTDDYVLVEFAAKLEEDYQKIYPQPLEETPSKSTE